MFIFCSVCSNGDVRLMNGSEDSASAGRVEVCFSNVYGSVCNDRWDERDASVVCRQLGIGRSCTLCTSHASYVIYNFVLDNNNVIAIRDGQLFGNNSLPIFLDDVVCRGSETNLLQCSHGGIHQHNCDLSDVAGVICGGRTWIHYNVLHSLNLGILLL